jgi:hypothetical protein
MTWPAPPKQRRKPQYQQYGHDLARPSAFSVSSPRRKEREMRWIPSSLPAGRRPPTHRNRASAQGARIQLSGRGMTAAAAAAWIAHPLDTPLADGPRLAGRGLGTRRQAYQNPSRYPADQEARQAMKDLLAIFHHLAGVPFRARDCRVPSSCQAPGRRATCCDAYSVSRCMTKMRGSS